ncbi:GlcG/HbpS family heme-binding protein [Pararhizobium mangrovi]|uniref:Heme-binding protein n=1 Tax=Pararhizobium mangrovi TaxID=2590452 RepID=A0A506UA35_9HYPH|nr:heme-binding protein [Pararhizobium mangrovi]TPW30740.1 heme-binding protein [Pararhizobium mangrovi]
MREITLNRANRIINAAFAEGKKRELKPLAVVVLDAGGHVKAVQRQDGASMLRFEVASGKAYGALALGVGSRWLHNQAAERPHFLEGLSGVSGDRVVPVPGGVLVRDGRGALLGAVGISGDSSDNDEACAIAGIEVAGFTPQAE